MGGETPDDFTKSLPRNTVSVPQKQYRMLTVEEFRYFKALLVALIVSCVLAHAAALFLAHRVSLLSNQVETLERIEGIDRVRVERVSQ